MTKYELMLVLPGTLDEKESETRSNEILSFLKESSTDATIFPMGKMRLAYPIKQIRYGYYYTLVFSVEASALKEIQNKLGLMRDLLRAIISIHNPKFSPAQKLSFSNPNEEANLTTSNADASHVFEEKFEKNVEKAAENKVSIQDIDKKLDEILSGNIIAGV